MRLWLATHKEWLSYVVAAVLLAITVAAWVTSGVELRALRTENDQTARLHDLAYAAYRGDTARVAAGFRSVAANDAATGDRLRPSYAGLPGSLPRFEAGVDAELVRLSHTTHRQYPAARYALISALVASLLLMAVLLWQFLTQRRAGRIDRDNAQRSQELARLRDEFVAVVSHELRTPLTSILGYIELIGEEEPGLASEQRVYFDVVKRNANRLLYLVSDLLLVAESDDGRLRLDVQDVDLQSVLRESVETAEVAAAAKHIELTLTAPEVHLQGDPLRLAQMIDNLLTNAVKFTGERGRVAVTCSVGDGAAVVEVADSGIGMSAADREQVFERFFRARAVTESSITGAGLGLSITKAIVDAHGGSIAVDSRLGAGTTFRVWLPLGQELEPVAPGVGGVEAPHAG